MSKIPQLFLKCNAADTATDANLLEYNVATSFSHCSILGCVIYVYVVAHTDNGFAFKLHARFSDHPVKIHFDLLRRLAQYLHMAKDLGLADLMMPNTDCRLLSNLLFPGYYLFLVGKQCLVI